jgi:hypothetical protein
MVWTCDRCRASVEIPAGIYIDQRSGSPIAFEHQPVEWFVGGMFDRGWEEFRDDESVTHVCPNCLTPGEQADRLLREADSARIFGTDDQRRSAR